MHVIAVYLYIFVFVNICIFENTYKDLYTLYNTYLYTMNTFIFAHDSYTRFERGELFEVL